MRALHLRLELGARDARERESALRAERDDALHRLAAKEHELVALRTAMEASLRALRDATMNAIDSIKEFLAESKDTNEVEVDLYKRSMVDQGKSFNERRAALTRTIERMEAACVFARPRGGGGERRLSPSLPLARARARARRARENTNLRT